MTHHRGADFLAANLRKCCVCGGYAFNRLSEEDCALADLSADVLHPTDQPYPIGRLNAFEEPVCVLCLAGDEQADIHDVHERLRDDT